MALGQPAGLSTEVCCYNACRRLLAEVHLPVMVARGQYFGQFSIAVLEKARVCLFPCLCVSVPRLKNRN